MEVLIFAALIGLLPAYIASNRGSSFFAWWLFGALLFIVALPCSFFVKNTSGKQCKACKEYVDKNATLCRFCRSEV